MYKYLIALTSNSLGFEKTLAVVDTYTRATELQKHFDKLLENLSKEDGLEDVFIESNTRIFQFPLATDGFEGSRLPFEEYCIEDDYLPVWIKSFIRVV